MTPRPTMLYREDAANVIRIAAKQQARYEDAARLLHLAELLERDPEALRCRRPGCPLCKEARG